MTRPLRIFISYKRENQAFAEELREKLLAWGYGTWMDIFDIPKGAYWPDEIDAGLQASDVVIGVMSPQAIQSRNVKNEWDWAIVNRKRLIPLMLELCVVPMNYVSINYIDFTRDKPRGFDDLQAALEKPHTPSMPADPYRPYLEKLYERINTYLAQKIVPTLRDDEDRPEPIRLRSEATPNAVLFEKRQEIDPLFAIGGIQSEEATEQVQVYDDFERAFNHYDGRVLLLGEPGAGKTITLLHFGRDAVVRRIQDPTQPLPILLIVPTWDPEKHKTFTDWVIQSYDPPEHAAQIIGHGEALLLLDGLDELGSERPIDPNKPDGEKYDPRPRFMHLIPDNNKVLVTCRVKDYEDIGEKIALQGAATLKPLDDAQLRAYLQNQPELMAAVEGDAGLREMLSTPLLLSFFAFAYRGMTEAERQQLSDLSESPGDLRDAIFRKYVEERYDHESRKPNAKLPYTVEQIYEVLGRAAIEDAVYWGTTHISVSEINDLNSVVFIEQVCALHLLVRLDSHSLRFIHMRLRDHFIFGRAIVALSDSDEFVRADAAAALGDIRDTRAVEPLIAALGNGDKHLRASSAIGLGGFNDERAVEALITALYDSDHDVRGCAARALGRIGNRRAVEPLITLLADNDAQTRGDAAVALGEIGDTRAVEPLIVALSDEYQSVNWRVTDALKQIGEPAVVPLITTLSGNSDANIREQVADLLAQIGGGRVVEPLIAALYDAEASVRKSAAKALSQIANTRAVDVLITVFGLDSIEEVRNQAAKTLGKIGGARAVEPLITSLRETHRVSGLTVSEALAHIGEPAVESLIATLRDSLGGVRLVAAMALGEIGDARAVEPLIAALVDTDRLVIAHSALALRKMGEPAVERLIAALHDEFENIRAWAAWELGEIREIQAVKPLIELLSDNRKAFLWHEERVCVYAAMALMGIGTPEALAAVEQWWREQGS